MIIPSAMYELRISGYTVLKVKTALEDFLLGDIPYPEIRETYQILLDMLNHIDPYVMNELIPDLGDCGSDPAVF